MSELLWKTVVIALVQGEGPDGVPIYTYVAVRGDRFGEFMAAQRAGPFYAGDYGIVIKDGTGQPSHEVQQEMAAEYGFEHNRLVEVPGDEADSWLIGKLDAPGHGRKDKGALIVDAGVAVNRQLIQYFRQHPAELKSIHPRHFEELVAELFAGFGYLVELTKPTRDGGVDVIAIRHAEVDTKYLIECKCPSVRGYVSVRPVRELLGLKKDTGATKVILATTTRFSHDAKELQTRNRWELELRDYNGILEWIDRYLATKER